MNSRDSGDLRRLSAIWRHYNRYFFKHVSQCNPSRNSHVADYSLAESIGQVPCSIPNWPTSDENWTFELQFDRYQTKFYNLDQAKYPHLMVYRPGNVIMMIADGMAPNRRHAICTHHADQTVSISSDEADSAHFLLYPLTCWGHGPISLTMFLSPLKCDSSCILLSSEL